MNILAKVLPRGKQTEIILEETRKNIILLISLFTCPQEVHAVEEPCHRKEKSNCRPFLKSGDREIGQPQDSDCQDELEVAMLEHLCQVGMRLTSTSIFIPICISFSRGKLELAFISSYLILMSLLILLIFSPPVQDQDWVVDVVPMWLGGLLSVVAPSCLAIGLRLLSPELTLLAAPSTVAWLVALQTEARVLRIRSTNPSVRDFARATKSIRTWAVSWLVCILVLASGLIYYSITPLKFDISSNWVVCAALAAAFFSSLAKVLGESKSEELEIHQEMISNFSVPEISQHTAGILQIPYVRLNFFSYCGTFLVLTLM
jgi:hypothetical protein